MVIVTGGAGFIGSAFVSKLNAQGIDGIVIVDNLKTSENWKNLVGLRYVDYCHHLDFLEQVKAGKWDHVDAVVHMGACSSTTETDGDYLMKNNYEYTKILAQWCLSINARFVYASSAATYGDGSQGFSDEHSGIDRLRPINRYGYSKQVFDQYALRTGIIDKIAGLKFFNVYGPNEYHKEDMKSMVCKAYSQINATGEIKLFKSYKPDYDDGGQMRDFIYVKDCVDVMYWLLNSPQVNGVYNLGTGEARDWNALARATFLAMEEKPVIHYIEMPENLKNQYQYFTQADMRKLRNAGYTRPFTPLEDGIKEYVQQYLAQNRYL